MDKKKIKEVLENSINSIIIEKSNLNNLYKSNTNDDFMSHGIGLQIVKQLVSELGGAVEISDRFGSRCEVVVKLPILSIKSNHEKNDLGVNI